MTVASRLDLDQELLVIAMCKALNDAPEHALRLFFFPYSLPRDAYWLLDLTKLTLVQYEALDAEAVRRQRLYREQVRKNGPVADASGPSQGGNAQEDETLR